MYGDFVDTGLALFKARYTPPIVALSGLCAGEPATYPPIPSITTSCNTVALLILNRVERLFCIEPPESKPDAGLTTVALILSPAIVVCAGTTIGNDASS